MIIDINTFAALKCFCRYHTRAVHNVSFVFHAVCN